jgi:hypothetical protein
MTNSSGAFAAIAPTFKVAMLGPSAVGKTSILVSMLDDAPRALAGQPVVLRAADEPTQRRIQSRRDQLHSGIAARSFNAGALRGDRAVTHYRLELRVQESADVRINIDFLDYPGAWLVPGEEEIARQTPEMAALRQAILDSDMLLVPADAVLLMEARRADQRKAVRAQHRIAAVEDIVEEWATARQGSDRPSLLVIAPLKTESYLADNGGHKDQAAELEAAVSSAYEGLRRRFAYNAPEGEVLYCPVDTLGCVELTRLAWEADGEEGLVASGRYMVRPGQGKISIRGAADILVAICRTVTSYTEELADEEAAKAGQESAEAGREAADSRRKKAQAVARHAEMTSTLSKTFFNWATRKTKANEQEQAAYAREQAEHERQQAAHAWESAQYTTYAEQLAKAVAGLATAPYQRARTLDAPEGAK